MDRLDLKDIEAFIRVVDTDSFTTAARALDVNQSVISTRVAHLEEQLQVRVLERGARRSTPTPAGKAILHRARALLAQSTELVLEARRQAETPSGELPIASSTVPGTFYLPTVLADLRRHAPGVVPDLQVTDSRRALDALRNLEVEVAVVGRVPDEVGLRVETIWSDPVVLVASRMIAAGIPDQADLADVPLILRQSGSATREVVLASIRAQSEDEIKVVMRVPDGEVAREAAMAGIGATFVSERAVARELATGQLVRLDHVFRPAHRPITLVTRESASQSAAASLLCDLLRARAQG
jgi:DNA-binding transcriptional LysR family regulator